MRIFVTGGTGFIGSAVVRELLAAGHQVVGLARSEEGAAALVRAGAEVHSGSIHDPESLYRGAAAADGVIHLAFTNLSVSTDYAASCQADVHAIDVMGKALEGSGRPFVVTSVTSILAPDGGGREESAVWEAHPRTAPEKTALAYASRDVRACVVRLPSSVHGTGDKGFVPELIRIARTTGASCYVGDGSNRWPAVHREDAAVLYRLALEQAPAGARLHAVGDEGVSLRDIARVIGVRLGLPVVSIPREEADSHFGWLARFAVSDHPASSFLTRRQLGWVPVQPSLLADMEQGYFHHD